MATTAVWIAVVLSSNLMGIVRGLTSPACRARLGAGRQTCGSNPLLSTALKSLPAAGRSPRSERFKPKPLLACLMSQHGEAGICCIASNGWVKHLGCGLSAVRRQAGRDKPPAQQVVVDTVFLRCFIAFSNMPVTNLSGRRCKPTLAHYAMLVLFDDSA